jgi:uncharacterized membrane protein YphA (DoxX/SURF4 family)
MNRREQVRNWVGAALRVGLGFWVGWLGLAKVLDPVTFLKAVRQYDVIHSPWLLNATAILLPWLEVFCAVLLVVGIAVRGTSWLLACLLAGFTVLVGVHGWQLAAAQGLAPCAVRFDCGCGTGEVWLCTKLLENAVMLGVSVVLGSGRLGRAGSVRYALLAGCATRA